MSDETAAAPAEGTAATETPGPDYTPVMDRLQELAGTIDTRFQGLEQRIPQPEAEQPADPWAALTGGQEPEESQYFDQFGNPVTFEQPQQGLDVGQLQQAVQAQIQQAISPYQAQIQQLQQAAARDQLLKDIPQLGDPAVADKAYESMASDLQGAPPEVASWLMNNPTWIGKHFKAAEAENLARAQEPASDGVPSLEAAGGAAPGGDGTQPSIVKQAYSVRHPYPKGF